MIWLHTHYINLLLYNKTGNLLKKKDKVSLANLLSIISLVSDHFKCIPLEENTQQGILQVLLLHSQSIVLCYEFEQI